MPIRPQGLKENFKWYQVDVPSLSWVCGYCGHKVSEDQGYIATVSSNAERVLIVRACTHCGMPTVFTKDGTWQFPNEAPGKPVNNVPDELTEMYEEARLAAGAGAFTASVMASRKMLMNISVKEGAKEGDSFVKYVEYLADNGFVPPNGRVWVDYVRKKGNEANHEIALMTEQDAKALLAFVEMLLRFIYEFPNLVPAVP